MYKHLSGIHMQGEGGREGERERVERVDVS